MLYIVLLLITMTSSHHTLAMLGNSLPRLPIMNGTCSAYHAPIHPVTGLIERTSKTEIRETGYDITSLPPTIRRVVVQDAVLQAVERGDVDQVESHFSKWQHWVRPWEYYRTAVAIALLHAAKLPQEKTGKMVERLLVRVSLNEIAQNPQPFADAAVKNNHTALIKYINTLFGKRYVLRATQTAESPLHQAAAQGDYHACFATLTTWSGPIHHDAMIPFDAATVIRTTKDSNSAEYQNALKKISAFTVNFQKFIDMRLALAKELRQTKNAQGQTAQDIARETDAPTSLIALLDPENIMAIQDAILRDIEMRTVK